MPMKKKYRDPFREDNQHDEAAAPAGATAVGSGVTSGNGARPDGCC